MPWQQQGKVHYQHQQILGAAQSASGLMIQWEH
jgi:hypothetical protein